MLSSKGPIFVFLFVIAIFTRFFKLNWGDGFFFNPDENNMANSVLQMNRQNLDPKFYAYGQFPLYLTFFTTPKHDFKFIVLTLRFWSAFFSFFSLVILYYVGLKIFNSKKYSLVFLLLLIFTPGLIQMAHFGTTESILLFVFVTNIYLSFKIYDNQKTKYLIFASLISGIGLATKISSLILTTPIFLSLLFLFLKKIKVWQLFLNLFIFILLTLFVGIIFSPYSLISFSKFISTMKYEIGVASGQIPVFYTRQFLGSIPYLFQFQKIFPYVNGLPVFIFGIVGFCLIFKHNILHHKSNIYLLLTLFPSLIFFIYQGQLFAKWTRFVSPIFFIFPLLSIFVFKKIKSNSILFLLILFCILPGIVFMKTYFSSDIRVQASNWINNNIPPNTNVLSEGGNVVDIPLSGHLDIVNYDFYELDKNFNNLEKLNQLISQSDYIFIPTRRIFKNQNNSNFPYSQAYYQSLFSGQLNFNLIKLFSKNNSLFLNSENAEETWSVFDNPTIRIYSKKG
jgi:hypothetical protein